jgi:DNA (cytosine-5)-methyltransferase 1
MAKNVLANKKTVLSLFSGCGGMDLGIEGDFFVYKRAINLSANPEFSHLQKNKNWVKLPKTNFEIIFANDILKEAKNAYVPFFERRNSKHIFHSESIVDLVKKAKAGIFSFPKADVVVGGFPCQDFSIAGKRLGLNSHKSHNGKIEIDIPSNENRGHLYMWMKHVVDIVEPKVFIAENVKGLISLGGVKQIIENDFRNISNGYVVLDAKILHSGNFGVPQARERVIFMGFNKKYLKKETVKKLENGEIDPYPVKTHYLPNDAFPDKILAKYVSLAEIFSDLQEPSKSTDLSQQAYSKAKLYGNHAQGNYEVNLNCLSPTIRAEHHGNIEFRRLSRKNGGKNFEELKERKKERRLTIRECARIQTFPDDFEFVRPSKKSEYPLSMDGGYRVIGNAVPPLLGFHIAWSLQNKWSEIFGE